MGLSARGEKASPLQVTAKWFAPSLLLVCLGLLSQSRDLSTQRRAILWLCVCAWLLEPFKQTQGLLYVAWENPDISDPTIFLLKTSKLAASYHCEAKDQNSTRVFCPLCLVKICLGHDPSGCPTWSQLASFQLLQHSMFLLACMAFQHAAPSTWGTLTPPLYLINVSPSRKPQILLWPRCPGLSHQHSYPQIIFFLGLPTMVIYAYLVIIWLCAASLHTPKNKEPQNLSCWVLLLLCQRTHRSSSENNCRVSELCIESMKICREPLSDTSNVSFSNQRWKCQNFILLHISKYFVAYQTTFELS